MKTSFYKLTLIVFASVLFNCNTNEYHFDSENGNISKALEFDYEDNIGFAESISPTMIRINNISKEILILDQSQNSVYFYNQNGDFIRKIGGQGQGPGDLLYPSKIALDEYGNIYVYELGNKRISVFDANGSYKSSFQAFGHAAFSMEITPDEKILLNQPDDGFYITKYSINGQFEKRIGRIYKYSKDNAVNFVFARSFVFHNSDNNYVVFLRHMGIVKVFSEEGDLLDEKLLKGIEWIDYLRNNKYVAPELQSGNTVFVFDFFNDVHYRNEIFQLLTNNPGNEVDGSILFINNEFEVTKRLDFMGVGDLLKSTIAFPFNADNYLFLGKRNKKDIWEISVK